MIWPNFFSTLLFLATISQPGDSRALGLSNYCDYESCLNSTLGISPGNDTSDAPSTNSAPDNSSSSIPLGFVNINDTSSASSNDSTSDGSSSNVTLGFVYINSTGTDLRHRSIKINKSALAELTARSTLKLRQSWSTLKTRIVTFTLPLIPDIIPDIVPDIPEPVVPAEPEPGLTGGTSETPYDEPEDPENPDPYQSVGEPEPIVRPSPSPSPKPTDDPVSALTSALGALTSLVTDASSSSDQPSPTLSASLADDPDTELGHTTITSASSTSASTEATCNAS